MPESLAPRLKPRPSIHWILWLPIGISGVLVLTLLAAMLGLAWRNLGRLAPVESHLAHMDLIQGLALGMEQTLLQGLRGARITPQAIAGIRDDLQALARREGARHAQTRPRLQDTAALLAQVSAAEDPLDVVLRALGEVRKVLQGEREEHDRLLEQMARDTAMEVRLTALLLVFAPLLLGASLLILNRRTRWPLRALEELLTRLANRDFQPVGEIMLRGADRLALPAFRSYNELVARLQALEAEHRDREGTLEQEVRHAAAALLAQSRDLARAERLAAVGAVSAGLAHEIRNPLAGVRMACTGLQQELGASDHGERLAAVVRELDRINDLLSLQLQGARHDPEPPRRVAIQGLIGDLLTLLQYQLPPGIVITQEIAPGLCCLLPAAGLRQALLNLILNAMQALGSAGLIQIHAQREGPDLVIRVDDDGPGLPPQLLQAGIRPFATGRPGGSGLGLAMVRRLVRDCDGELKLANREPQGASVTLRLPCRLPQEGGGGAGA